MRKLIWLATWVALGVFCSSAIAQGPVTNYCVLGAKQAAVSGLNSTNYLQGIIRGCTVTVYLTGTTTPATLFSNSSGTPLGNPFTANATTGQWLFYASTSNLYDVVLTGGTAPNTYPAPVTLTGLQPGGGGGGGSGCTPGGATNSLQKNNGSGGCGASSITDNGTTVVGTEPVTFPAVNTVINAGSSLSTAVTACGSAQTTIQITQTIAVGTGITVPTNCTLLFQSAGNLTGTSITINGPVQSSRHQVFGSGLAVTLGPLTTEVPIEWFGGKADATGSVGVGTDNLAPFNAAHTALVAGCIQFGVGGYRFSGTPSISKVNMCVEGQTVGYPATAASISANSTNLYIDSASADGPTFTSAATWGIIRNLAVLRTQTPTGTAKGISVSAGGVIVLNVSVQDSVYNVYFHGAGADGTGQITNNSVGWGLTGLAGAPSPASCGFFVDSSGAIPSASIKFLYDSATSNLSGAGGGTTGLCASGTNLSDIYILRFETAGTNLGIDLENTGTGSFVSQDIQLIDSVLNGCLTACLKINGMGSTTDIAPHVFVIGGDFFATGTSAIGAFIENSTNVSLTNVQMFVGSTGSSAQTDVVLNTVNGFQINDNDFSGQSFINISCISSSNGTMTGNKIKTGNTTTGATGIKNVGCSNVVEQGNTIAGNGGIALVNGITFDATSSNNGPWSLNTIDAATVTTPVTDAGTHNNDPQTNSSRMSQFTSTAPGVVSASGGGTTNFLRADNTWAAPAGGSATIIQVNGTPTATITPVNLRNGTGNGGIAITNPSTGNVDFNLSKPFGSGTNFTTGVASNTLNELAYFPGTDGRVADSTILITDVMQLSGNQTATGTKTLPSPVFTGTPTAPTATAGTNTTQLATTAFVTSAFSAYTPTFAQIASGTNAGSTMTCGTGCNITFSTGSINASLLGGTAAASYALLASPAFTGTPTAPTAAANTNTTQLATTAYVVGQAGTATPLVDGSAAVGTSLLYARQDHVHPTDTTRAPLASPTFTGVPAGPTATVGTNTTQLATTAFVLANGSSTVFQQNGVGLTSSSTVNFQSGSGINVTNPSAGNVAFNLSIVPIANGGTGASSFTAHSFFGNPTGSTAAPAQSLIGTNDWSPNAYITGAGSVNVMTATLAPVATAYTAGLQVDVLPNLANTTTTPTLNVNGLGAKTITKCGTTALVAGDYTTTAVAEFVYDGTQMQLVNPQAVGCGSGGSGSAMGTVYHSFVVNNLGVAASNSYTVGSDGLAASVAGAGRGYGYFVVLKAGTITSIDYQVRSPSTGAISATCSMDLESITGTVLTGTTATTAVTGSTLVDVQVTGLSIAVTAGQKISVAFNVPAGATSGSSVVFAASVEVD